MKTVRTMTFDGVKWRLKTVPDSKMDDHWGVCLHDTKTIVINEAAKGFRQLDTYVHESLHASYPFMKEFWVGLAGTDIAKFLWRLGYRLPVEEEYEYDNDDED